MVLNALWVPTNSTVPNTTSPNLMIRPTLPADADALMGIVADSGQFDADALAHVRDTLDRHLRGEDDDLWLTAEDGHPIGVAYCASEAVTQGTWNLLMLWTHRDVHGRGHGRALVACVERALAARGARLLIVETSGLPGYATARAFYDRCGFRQEARIRDFYADGDDKLVYTKALAAAAR